MSETSTTIVKEHHSIQDVVMKKPSELGVPKAPKVLEPAIEEEQTNDGHGLGNDPIAIHSLSKIGVTVPDPKWTPPGRGRYPEYKDGTHIFESTPAILEESDNKARLRREAIRNTMKHAWNGYKKCAWGMDEVKPQTCRGENVWGGMGTTLVDALDTLWLMGMKDEFWEARDWVRDHLDHNHVGYVSVFETTIRSLGGLLSAYDWSGDKAFLEKAEDLGRRLGRAFDAAPKTGIPAGRVILGGDNNNRLRGGSTNIAEAGTLQLEFRVSFCHVAFYSIS